MDANWRAVLDKTEAQRQAMHEQQLPLPSLIANSVAKTDNSTGMAGLCDVMQSSPGGLRDHADGYLFESTYLAPLSTNASFDDNQPYHFSNPPPRTTNHAYLSPDRSTNPVRPTPNTSPNIVQPFGTITQPLQPTTHAYCRVSQNTGYSRPDTSEQTNVYQAYPARSLLPQPTDYTIRAGNPYTNLVHQGLGTPHGLPAPPSQLINDIYPCNNQYSYLPPQSTTEQLESYQPNSLTDWPSRPPIHPYGPVQSPYTSPYTFSSSFYKPEPPDLNPPLPILYPPWQYNCRCGHPHDADHPHLSATGEFVIEHPFRFRDLHAELRNMVYRFATQSTDPLQLRALKPPAITRASRQLRSESIPIFFDANTFIAQVTTPYSGRGEFLYNAQYGQGSARYAKGSFLTEADGRFMKTCRLRIPMQIRTFFRAAGETAPLIKNLIFELHMLDTLYEMDPDDDDFDAVVCFGMRGKWSARSFGREDIVKADRHDYDGDWKYLWAPMIELFGKIVRKHTSGTSGYRYRGLSIKDLDQFAQAVRRPPRDGATQLAWRQYY